MNSRGVRNALLSIFKLCCVIASSLAIVDLVGMLQKSQAEIEVLKSMVLKCETRNVSLEYEAKASNYRANQLERQIEDYSFASQIEFERRLEELKSYWHSVAKSQQVIVSKRTSVKSDTSFNNLWKGYTFKDTLKNQ